MFEKLHISLSSIINVLKTIHNYINRLIITSESLVASYYSIPLDRKFYHNMDSKAIYYRFKIKTIISYRPGMLTENNFPSLISNSLSKLISNSKLSL
jgi:hypothetical protein